MAKFSYSSLKRGRGIIGGGKYEKTLCRPQFFCFFGRVIICDDDAVSYICRVNLPGIER